MIRDREIIGAGLTSEDEEKIRTWDERRSKKGIEPALNEAEKTDQDLRFINSVNQVVQKEVEAMGFPAVPEISPDRIHFLGQSEFQHMKRPNTLAYQDHATESIFVNIDTLPRPERYRVLLHEVVHMYGARKYYVMIDREKKELDLKVRKYGYNIYDNQAATTVLQGLNEAMVEIITSDLFEKYPELEQEADIPPDKSRVPVPSYAEYVRIVNTIVQTIADKQGVEKGEVMEQWKRGHFTGDLMHLREVDHIFGKNSIRVLGALMTLMDNQPLNRLRSLHLDKKVLEYFDQLDDPTKRPSAEVVLQERDELLKDNKPTATYGNRLTKTFN